MSTSIDDILANAVQPGQIDDLSGPAPIEVEIVDDRAPEDRVEPSDTSGDDHELTEAEIQGLGQKVQKRMGELTWKFTEEKRQRETAERLREEAIRFATTQQEENGRMRTIMAEGETVLLSEVRSRTKSDVDQARLAHLNAVEAGDAADISAAQMALNRAQIEQHQAEVYSPQLVNQQAQAPAQQAAQAPQVNVAQAPQRDEVFDKWRSENAWFDSNRSMRAVAMDVHNEIQESGGTIVGSDEYYTKIESVMNREFPGFFKEAGTVSGAEGNSEPAASPAPSVVAPSSRNAGTPSPRKVQLTETQRALAARLGIPIEVYAREHLALESKKNQ